MSQRKRARTERRRQSRSVQRELARAGVKARLEEIRLAMRDPVFTIQLHDALAWAELPQLGRRVLRPLTHADQVRDLALGVLKSLGYDINGINIKIITAPDGSWELRAALTPDVAAEAVAKAKERLELR